MAYDIVTTSGGTRSGSYTINAVASRNIVTADVLDYDGYKGNYALIWKKITIAQTQSYNITGVGAGTAGYNNSWLGTGTINWAGSTVWATNATRKVEFYLTYKINGVKTDKLLCTCEMVSSGPTPYAQSFSGERVWGVSIQVGEKFITYQFRKEEPVDGATRNWGGSVTYDGHYAFESWLTDDDEVELWKFKSHVVGLVNINDGSDSEVGYLKEQEYNAGAEGSVMAGSEVYSVGVAEIGG